MKKRIVVTTTMVARMRLLRSTGLAYRKIAADLDISELTVMRHLSEHHRAMFLKHERNRYARDREKRQALQREYEARKRQKAE